MLEKTSHDVTLMQVLGFTQGDLEANRAGQMSEMQHYTLRVRRRQSIFIGGIILLGIVFIASVFIFLGQREGGSPILTVIGIGLTICNAALAGLFARYWLRLSADIRAGQVRATTGTLERIIKPVNRRVINYMIRVDGVEVFVSKEAFDTFQHQQPYTLYRALHIGTLLSAECLETP